MGVAEDVEVARGERRGQVHRGRLVVRPDAAAAPAIGRPEAGGPRLHGLRRQFLRGRVMREEATGDVLVILAGAEHGAVDGDDGDAELGDVFLEVEFAGPGLRRREQRAVGRIGRVLQAFVRTVDPDKQLHLVVIRGDILVGDGPVEAEAVAGVGFEIIRAVAQGDASPVVGATPEHAGAPPPEPFLGLVIGLGVGLVRDLPPPVHGGIGETEGLLAGGQAAQGHLVRRLEHRCLRGRVVVATGLQQEDLHAVHGERVSGLAAAGAGADDDHVVIRTQFFFRDDGHGRKRSAVQRTRQRQCSSKKPASGIAPGAWGVTGVLRSMTAQSGSFGTCRALLR